MIRGLLIAQYLTYLRPVRCFVGLIHIILANNQFIEELIHFGIVDSHSVGCGH